MFSRTSRPCPGNAHDLEVPDPADPAVAEATYPFPAGFTPLYGRQKSCAEIPAGWAAGTRQRLIAWNQYCAAVVFFCEQYGVTPIYFRDVPACLAASVRTFAASQALQAVAAADVKRLKTNASKSIRWADPP